MFSKIMAALIVLITLCLGTLAVLSWSTPSFAQEAAGSSSINIGDFLAPLQPYIVELVTILAGALVSFISVKINALTGLKIDAANRELLHKALENGLMAGVHAAQNAAKDKEVDVQSVIVAEGVRYAQSYVPGAIKYFGLTPDKLGDMIRAKIPVLTDA